MGAAVGFASMIGSAELPALGFAARLVIPAAIGAIVGSGVGPEMGTAVAKHSRTLPLGGGAGGLEGDPSKVKY